MCMFGSTSGRESVMKHQYFKRNLFKFKLQHMWKVAIWDQSVTGVQQSMQHCSLPNYINFQLWGGCKAKKTTSLREDIWCFWWHFYHHQGEVFLAPWYCYVLILLWCELFKAKSNRKISIHWIAQLVSLTFICWIANYLVDSAIQHLNNWVLLSNTNCLLPKQ